MRLIKCTLLTTLALFVFNQSPLVNVSANNWPEIAEKIVSSSDKSENKTDETKTESAAKNSNATLERYDTQAMANLGVEAPNLDHYDSLSEAIYDLIDEYDLDYSQVAVAYTNLQTGENLYINEDEQMIVASLYKVPMVAMYIDLIDAGYLSWDSQLPYYDEYYQDGAGDITAGEKRDYYSLEELAYQAIVYSDNTASFILYYYYLNNYGNFRTALLDFVEYYDVDDIYYYDNYGSAYMMNEALVKIANDPKYEPLTDLMMQSYPKQLFSLFVNNMATKYGQYEGMLNDSGIYYGDGEPVYTLVVMTRDSDYPEIFLGELNLIVNQWSNEIATASIN